MSLEGLARAALKTWLESLAWTLAPTVATEEPSPGVTVPLPTCAAVFTTVRRTTEQRSVVSAAEAARAVWRYGELDADLEIIFRARNMAEAEAFREEFRTGFLLAAPASNGSDAETLRLAAEFYGVAVKVSLRLKDADFLGCATAKETGLIDFWELTFFGTLDYPLFVQEPATGGTGRMGILINGGETALDPYAVLPVYPAP